MDEFTRDGVLECGLCHGQRGGGVRDGCPFIFQDLPPSSDDGMVPHWRGVNDPLEFRPLFGSAEEKSARRYVIA